MNPSAEKKLSCMAFLRIIDYLYSMGVLSLFFFGVKDPK